MSEHTPETNAIWRTRRPDNPETIASELDTLARRLEAERDRLKASNAELLALCKRAINESARVRPDFMADLQAAITRAALSRATETKG